MIDGICRTGYTLDPSACGHFERDGERMFPEGRTDEQMYALGFSCEVKCGGIDSEHRIHSDPNGGVNCSDVYSTYNEGYNCCVKSSPTSLPTSVPTSLPTSVPLALPTALPTYTFNPIFSFDFQDEGPECLHGGCHQNSYLLLGIFVCQCMFRLICGLHAHPPSTQPLFLLYNQDCEIECNSDLSCLDDCGPVAMGWMCEYCYHAPEKYNHTYRYHEERFEEICSQTFAPVPNPTQLPTVPPTPLPTAQPTHNPTPLPTVVPTQLPTTTPMPGVVIRFLSSFVGGGGSSDSSNGCSSITNYDTCMSSSSSGCYWDTSENYCVFDCSAIGESGSCASFSSSGCYWNYGEDSCTSNGGFSYSYGAMNEWLEDGGDNGFYSLVTSEDGIKTAKFNISLLTEPLDDVVIRFTSTTGDVEAYPPSVTFNWRTFSVPQKITVRAVSDFIAEGVTHSDKLALAVSSEDDFDVSSFG